MWSEFRNNCRELCLMQMMQGVIGMLFLRRYVRDMYCFGTRVFQYICTYIGIYVHIYIHNKPMKKYKHCISPFQNSTVNRYLSPHVTSWINTTTKNGAGLTVHLDIEGAAGKVGTAWWGGMLHQRTCQLHGTSGATARFHSRILGHWHKNTFLVGIHRGIPLPPSAVSNFEMLSDYMITYIVYVHT